MNDDVISSGRERFIAEWVNKSFILNMLIVRYLLDYQVHILGRRLYRQVWGSTVTSYMEIKYGNNRCTEI